MKKKSKIKSKSTKKRAKKNPSEREFFLEKIENNLMTTKYLLDKYNDKFSEKDLIDIQRMTGNASRLIKDLVVSKQLIPTQW